MDDVEDVAAEYKITAMPTFIFLKKKEQVSDFSKPLSSSQHRWLS